MKKSALHIIIALAAGLLIGFVLGIAYCASDALALTDAESARGNIAELSKLMYQHKKVKSDDAAVESQDTIRLQATDEKGKNWNIILTK